MGYTSSLFHLLFCFPRRGGDDYFSYALVFSAILLRRSRFAVCPCAFQVDKMPHVPATGFRHFAFGSNQALHQDQTGNEYANLFYYESYYVEIFMSCHAVTHLLSGTARNINWHCACYFISQVHPPAQIQQISCFAPFNESLRKRFARLLANLLEVSKIFATLTAVYSRTRNPSC